MRPTQRRLVRRRVLSLSLPYVIESLFDATMFYADMIMIGYFNTIGLAALGIAGPITYTLNMVLGALRVGIVATVSRAVGEGDPDKQVRTAATGLVVMLVVGAAGSALGLTLLPYLTHLFPIQDQPEAVSLAFDYILITAGALLFFLMQIGGSAVLRAAGNTRVPMAIGIVCNALNIAANYALIFGAWGFPQWGVRGAAAATAISQAVYGIAVTAFLFTARSPIRLRPANLRQVEWKDVRMLLRISLPAALEPLILQTGFLLYIRAITSLGFLAIATHRVAIAIEALTFMPGNAIAIACSALVGQALGARKPEEAVQSIRESSRLALYFMSAIGIVFLLFGTSLMEIFVPRRTADADVIIATGAACLAIVVFSEPFFSLALTLGGALRGAGDTKTPVLVAVIGVWGVRVPCAYLLSITFGMGLYGAWVTMVIDWFVRMLVLQYFYRKGRWKEITL